MRSSHLYRLLFVLIAGVLSVATATAQTDYRTKSSGMLTIGAGFAGGASVILEPPPGSKTKPVFAMRLTADVTFPLNPTVATMLSLGLDSRGWRLHPHDASDAWTDTKISYFSIYPAFKFSAFTLGVNFGFPMGASTVNAAGQEHDFTDAESNDLQTMVEPRLGVVIPVVDEDIGWLGLTLGGGVTVSDAVKVPSGAEVNFQTVSGHLGLTWQFGIKGTGIR